MFSGIDLVLQAGAGDSESEGVCCYSPHSRPITGLDFPVTAPHTVYTCGYDGSLRRGDLNKGVFDEVTQTFIILFLTSCFISLKKKVTVMFCYKCLSKRQRNSYSSIFD